MLPSAALPNTTGFWAGALALKGYHGNLGFPPFLMMFPPGAASDGYKVHADCDIGAHSHLNCSVLSKDPTQYLNILMLNYGLTALGDSEDMYPRVNITLKVAD